MLEQKQEIFKSKGGEINTAYYKYPGLSVV